MRHFCLFLSLVSCLLTFGAIKTVEGASTYCVPRTQSLAQAEEEAIRLAKIDALAREFGTKVLFTNVMVMTEIDSHFYSNGFDLVDGEWIETIGEPDLNMIVDNGELIMHCKIKGRAREKKKADIELCTKTLRSLPSLSAESTEFKDGNKMFVYFRTPVDGYVSIFLYDPASNEVYCLLPYRYSEGNAFEVKHDKDYFFFSKDKSDNISFVDEYIMNCSSDRETNTIYIMFSKNPFAKPHVQNWDSSQPSVVSMKEFTKWKSRCQALDPSFQQIALNITISK